MKNCLKFLLVFLIGFFFLFSSKSVSAFSGSGNGTSGDPYQVTTCSQLQEVNDGLTAYYVQENNIDCTGVTFTPIGISPYFTGSYDGNGYKITNLTIDTDGETVGLFGTIGTGGVVTKVGLVSGSVTANASAHRPSTGGIAGSNGGTITKSYNLVAVTTVADRSTTGGIAGYNSGTISDSYTTGTITIEGEDSSIGGVVGESSSGVVTRIYSTGSVVGGGPGGQFTGGLVGGSGGGSLSNSFSTATVDTSAPSVGGLVGSSGMTITNSYWNKVSGSPSNCYSGGDTGCTTINDNLAYFYTTSNPPMDTWDFVSVWSTQNNGSGFPIFKWQQTSSPTPSSNSSNSSSNSSPAIICQTIPINAPDLFQINTSKNSATVYFSSVLNATNYQVYYGYNSNANQYATFTNQNNFGGVLSYTVNNLPTNTNMYFKVYAQNNCGQGVWSNVMQAKIGRGTYYKNVSLPVASSLPKQTTVLGASTKTIPKSSVTPKPTRVPVVQKPKVKIMQVTPKKSCFLFFCW